MFGAQERGRQAPNSVNRAYAQNVVPTCFLPFGVWSEQPFLRQSLSARPCPHMPHMPLLQPNFAVQAQFSQYETRAANSLAHCAEHCAYD